MKTTYSNVSELSGAVNTLASQYDREVKDIDEDKALFFQVLDLQSKWKIEANWVSHFRADGETPEWADDHFYLLKQEDSNKLEKELHEILDRVTANKVEV